jgi:uncharacterized protein YeaO (DUF488 family)
VADARVPLKILGAQRIGQASMFKTKSIHTKIEAADGLRILATRSRGRGLPKERYDVWMANLGPSEELRNAFLTRKITWPHFSLRYGRELREGGTIDDRNKKIKNHGQKFTLRLLQHLARSQTVTLLCHCAEDEKHCHRHLLKALLESAVR